MLLARLDGATTTAATATLIKGDFEDPLPVRVSWAPDGTRLALSDRAAGQTRLLEIQRR